MTQMQEAKINTGEWCPDCNCKTVLVDSIIVYKVKSYGMIHQCPKCFAYVGCHKGTTVALGRVANEELRGLKKEAHKYFDMIWDLKFMSRDEAYSWLSQKLNLSLEQTHIGMFTIEQCRDTIYYSKQILNDMRRLDLDFGAKPKTEYFEI